MLYAVLCYNDEVAVWSKTREEDRAVMNGLQRVREILAAQGRLGPSLRLMPTTAATTLRKNNETPLVIDGPFAETKEQLLGIYVVDADNLNGALDMARDLAAVNPGGCYEVRPIAVFNPDPRTSAAETAPPAGHGPDK